MTFRLDDRLGIPLPEFTVPFEELSTEEQQEIIVTWESIRARIPDRILQFEEVIENILRLVHQEEDWDIIAKHFADISDYASRINELNTWRRVDPSLHPVPHDQLAAEHRDREK